MSNTAYLPEITLTSGSHPSRFDESGKPTMCANEYGAWLAGEDHSDRPACQDEVIGRFLISLNDNMPDDWRQKLRPLVVRSLGSAGDGRQLERAFMCADWAVRTAVPMALEAISELVGGKEGDELLVHARQLRELPEIADEASALDARAARAARAALDALDARAARAALDALDALWESALDQVERMLPKESVVLPELHGALEGRELATVE